MNNQPPGQQQQPPPPAPPQTPVQSTQTPKKRGFPTWLIVLLIILGILAILVFLIYWKFFGITAKQKYEKCANTCQELMLLESDIPMCKAKCEQIYNYRPTSTSTPKSTPSKTATPSKTTASPTSSSASPEVSKQYTCNYVWPQEIVEKSSQALTLICPIARPWCRPGQETYEDISCCANYSEETKEKTDCVKLPDLL